MNADLSTQILICRPINRILVAQKITTPQAVVAALSTLLHFVVNYLFVGVFSLGPVSVAWASSLSNLSQLILMIAYIAIYKRGYCIWGAGISMQAFKVDSDATKRLNWSNETLASFLLQDRKLYRVSLPLISLPMSSS